MKYLINILLNGIKVLIKSNLNKSVMKTKQLKPVKDILLDKSYVVKKKSINILKIKKSKKFI